MIELRCGSDTAEIEHVSFEKDGITNEGYRVWYKTKDGFLFRVLVYSSLRKLCEDMFTQREFNDDSVMVCCTGFSHQQSCDLYREIYQLFSIGW